MDSSHSKTPEESEFLLLQQCAALQTELAMAQGKDATRQLNAARRAIQRIGHLSANQADEEIREELKR